MTATLSHHTSSVPLDERTRAAAARAAERLRSAATLVLPLEEELSLLEQLQQFDFGRFLLCNAGLNGYWTSYVFRHRPGDPVATPLERWLLERSLLPGIRERFGRFRREIARYVRDGVTLASVPCGVMDDLCDQDYRSVRDVAVIGADIDPESVALARANAEGRGLSGHCRFLVRDAWDLGLDDEVDLLVSNGLNMYEPDPQRLIELYRNFARALRPGGRLITSFIPAPPAPPWVDPATAPAWERYGIAEADLRRDLAIFGDILPAKYLNFTSEDEIRDQVAAAGLAVVAVSLSDAGVLPVLTAEKVAT